MHSEHSTDIEPELLSLRSKLSAEIENDQKEIEFRKKRVAKNAALLEAVKGSLSVMERAETKVAASKNGYGAKADIVRSAINRISANRFTIVDVENAVLLDDQKSTVTRARLRTALWTMAEKQEIKLVKKGTNTSPAEYEKINGVLRTQRTTEEDRQQTMQMHATAS